MDPILLSYMVARQKRSADACQVHKHDEIVPYETHHIMPEAYHGPSIKANLIDLCANGHGNAHYLLDSLLKTGHTTLERAVQTLPWDYIRTFGPKTRAVAYEGFIRIMSAKVTPMGLEVDHSGWQAIEGYEEGQAVEGQQEEQVKRLDWTGKTLW